MLPGYVYFRYPAKLLVLTSLAVSLLAARGWDDAWRPATRGLHRGLLVLASVSAALLVGVLVGWSDIVPRLSTIEPDPLFGPFDADGAWRDVVTGLAQTFLVSLALLALALPAVRPPMEHAGRAGGAGYRFDRPGAGPGLAGALRAGPVLAVADRGCRAVAALSGALSGLPRRALAARGLAEHVIASIA